MMWSMPPAEPPAQVTLDTSFFTASARSLAVLIGELAGTTMTWVSSVSRAIGVTWSRLTGDLLVRMAPTMTKPLTMSWLPSPLAPLTNWAMPTVPPAPATLVTCTLRAIFSATSACCIDRAVWSQPPPGAAGAMILSSIWANADGANTATRAAPASMVRMTFNKAGIRFLRKLRSSAGRPPPECSRPRAARPPAGGSRPRAARHILGCHPGRAAKRRDPGPKYPGVRKQGSAGVHAFRLSRPRRSAGITAALVRSPRQAPRRSTQVASPRIEDAAQTRLPGKPASIQKGLFLGRGGTAQHVVAMGEAAEAADDVGVVLGIFQAVVVAQRAVEGDAAFLVGQRFRVHERQIEERAQVLWHRLVEAALQRAVCARAGERIGRKGAGAAAEHVARKLVEHDDERQRSGRRRLPRAQPPGRRGLIGGEKARANGGVEGIVLGEPFVGTGGLPEPDDFFRRAEACRVRHTRTWPV